MRLSGLSVDYISRVIAVRAVRSCLSRPLMPAGEVGRARREFAGYFASANASSADSYNFTPARAMLAIDVISFYYRPAFAPRQLNGPAIAAIFAPLAMRRHFHRRKRAISTMLTVVIGRGCGADWRASRRVMPTAPRHTLRRLDFYHALFSPWPAMSS